ncbi:tetratricopeptide repeat protein [Flavobacterium sp. Fl-77]|uniref:histidine kinase n=1 Tax=Flavobacterium flavipigmentatum TaxID=2893884 RepID=A0AAJ2S6E4_9FLAO|nr:MULTISPECIES: tetratricopeptide repeat-containing sensor histidine kinase [unclassified Flavobacterium]MDX6180797.1 tetratricopeptide repeat protein [Flavobacterium sp. Fl-33]MDX6184397.1 tetratricopeptide repeat protein [Flavobacterium sp. Fl-77]UFH39506.1 tetratricopeptide repeat protein [Flavobacterium sp. F-70]
MKNKYQILLFLFFILWACSKKNNSNEKITSLEDSLSTYLSLANDINLPLEFKQKYNQKAFNVIISQDNDSLNRVNLFKVANRYYNMSDWKAYKDITEIVLERSISSKDSANMAKAYTYLGDYYGSRSVADSAFLHYFRAEKLYLRIGDHYNLAKAFMSKASLQYNEGIFFESEIAVFKALSNLKGLKNVNDQLYECYNLLGLLYNEREEYDKALEFQNKALEVLQDKSIPSELQLKATSYNNIGFVYFSKRNYRRAKFFFEKGLAENNLFKEKTILYAILLDNIAYCNFKLNEDKDLPEQFFTALKIRDSLGLKAGIISSKIHLSEYFSSKKDTLRAIQYSKQALLMSRNSNRLRNTLEALKQLAIVDPENASVYSKEYIKLNEQMLKAERVIGEKFSRIEYETNEIKSENSNLEVQNRTLVYVFSFCTLIGLFFYIYKTQQAKNRELIFKQQQQIANEDIYNLMISQQKEIEATRIREKKKVAQELHDGVLGRMFGIRISLDSLNKIDEEFAAPKRKKYLAELKNIEQDIREISHDLSREKSELINNFILILTKLFDDQRNTYDTELIISMDSHINWDLVSNTIKINLYRIIQEALQNCNKYANATTISIEFKSEINHLVLSISDDGVGFNPKKAKKGIGLQNIFYRTEECLGAVSINSSKNEGTLITIKIPIDQKINLQTNDS